MKKTTLMNFVTVAAYAAIAVYVFVALVTFFVWVTGGFKKYTEQAGGLKFDCMAVSIADTEGTAKLRVLSEHAVAHINTSTNSIEYTDPSQPIELRLEVRDADGKLKNGIIEAPSKVMLGEEFEIKALVSPEDNQNIGGDCFLYAFSNDDMLSANPLPVFVDVQIQSATLLYYNIDVDPNTMYKRVVTQEKEVEYTDENGEQQTKTERFVTTLFYRTLADYQNDVNAIIPLNRQKQTSVSNDATTRSRFLLATDDQQEHFKNAVYTENAVECVKDDQFKLYVDVYPARALNPHTNSVLASKYLLNNLDADALSAVCAQIVEKYEQIKDDEEAVQNFVTMLSNVWPKLGLSNYVDISSFLTKNKIYQAIEKISNITSSGITSYYQNILGQNINFSNKNITFNTPDYRVAEVDDQNVLTIKSTPSSANVSDQTSLVNVSVQKIYDGTLGNAKVYNTYTTLEDQTLSVEKTQTTSFKIVEVYFEGLDLQSDSENSLTTEQLVNLISQRLSAPLYVNNNRLLVTAQKLTDEQKTALINSNLGYSQTEVDGAVNLGIVIKTTGNNQASNPNPLKSELKNIILTQQTKQTSYGNLLSIEKDSTTLGDDNVLWILTPLRASVEDEQFSLTISLVQELNSIVEQDQKYIRTSEQPQQPPVEQPENPEDPNTNPDDSTLENDPNLAEEDGQDEEGDTQEPQEPQNPEVVEPEQDSVKKIDIFEQKNSEGEVVYYNKVASITGFGFKVRILEPELKFQNQLNTAITKYDFDSRSSEYSAIDMQSLLTTEYDAGDYTYGTLVYLVVNNKNGVADASVVNVTSKTENEDSTYLGQLFIDAETIDNGSVVIDNSNRYRFIQPTGAGTVSIVPLLVMTERVNGVDYPLKKVDNTYARMTDEDIKNATFSIDDQGNVSTQDGSFVVRKKFSSIIVNVTERITELSYFLDDTFKTAYDKNKIFATGADNEITIYVRANSRLALPGSDSETTQKYSYKILNAMIADETESMESVRDEVIISYPSEQNSSGEQNTSISNNANLADPDISYDNTDDPDNPGGNTGDDPNDPTTTDPQDPTPDDGEDPVDPPDNPDINVEDPEQGDESQTVTSNQFGTKNKTHYMKFSIRINPLNSTGEKKYNIIWYTGTSSNPYKEEIAADSMDSKLNITAKDCFGNGAKVAFVTGEGENANTYSTTTTAYRTYLSMQSAGNYNVMLYTDNKTNYSNNVLPTLASDTNWDITETDGNVVTSLVLSGSQSATEGSNEKTDGIYILDYGFVAAKNDIYVQKEVNLSNQTCKQTYSWIKVKSKAEDEYEFEYSAMKNNEFSTYFSIIRDENDNQVLTLNNFIDLDTSIVGLCITNTYDPGFEVEEETTLPSVNQNIMIYNYARPTFSVLGNWQFATKQQDSETVADKTEILIDAEPINLELLVYSSEITQQEVEEEDENGDTVTKQVDVVKIVSTKYTQTCSPQYTVRYSDTLCSATYSASTLSISKKDKEIFVAGNTDPNNQTVGDTLNISYQINFVFTTKQDVGNHETKMNESTNYTLQTANQKQN